MAVLIVGASVAGIGTARALRTLGYEGPITVVGEELHAPYDKPPLSKAILAAADGDKVTALISPEEVERLGIDLRLGVRGVGLDLARRVVETAAGEALPFDELVIATGVHARILPGVAMPPGVYTLRSLDDAHDIRGELERARRVVIVGAGFIGAELASAARLYGVEVTIVEVQSTPMAHLFGDRVAGELNRLHAINGVTVRSGVQVTAFVGSDRVEGVQLADGEIVPADFAVVAIGARPSTGWLESSGLAISDGIECDERLQAVGASGVYAAGDVAKWPHGLYDDDLRIEHWTNANEHAAIVASAIVGAPAPAAEVPYVWSHQYGRMIQIVGLPRHGEPTLIEGDIAEGPIRAVYSDAADFVVGAVCVDDPRGTMTCRKAIKRKLTVSELSLGDLPPRR
jgi:NADPH-dependent 2,4-dienoyl-CoA reductase/sulfur reductase-like enzyme